MRYTPAAEAIRIAATSTSGFIAPAAPILLASADTRALVTYPLNTTATSAGFLRPKYDAIRSIVFEGFRIDDPDEESLQEAFRRLPSGFVQDPYFGLGLNHEYRHILDAIEDIDGIATLHIKHGSRQRQPAISGSSYILSSKAFDDARKEIGRIHRKALGIATDQKKAASHNALLTTIDPEKFPEVQRPYRKDAILEAIGKSLPKETNVSATDRRIIISTSKSLLRKVGETEPEALLELAREIDVVTLEELVARLDKLMAQKLRESAWQKFFVDNPFVLKLAFGIPIALLGEQISVGGRKFDGSGDKISDFAVKAAASGNLSLIEIKTPDTLLLEAKPYRGDLYAPSRDLSGSVNQVLDQRYQLQKSIVLLKDNSGARELESYAVQCLVLAGRTPTNRPELKSLELFRNGLKSVSVVTFDELRDKLGHLLEVLKIPGERDSPIPSAPDAQLKAGAPSPDAEP